MQNIKKNVGNMPYQDPGWQELGENLNKFLSVDLKNDENLSIEVIRNISQFKLTKFSIELLKSCLNNSDEFNLRFKVLERINRWIDSLLEDNEDLSKKIKDYYNIISFIKLYNDYYYYIKNIHRKQEFQKNFNEIMKNKNYHSIFLALEKNKFLSHSELAKKSHISSQNLSNHLAKIKNMGMITSHKSPTDKRSTYYSLSYELLEYLSDNNYMLEQKSISNEDWGRFYWDNIEETEKLTDLLTIRYMDNKISTIKTERSMR